MSYFPEFIIKPFRPYLVRSWRHPDRAQSQATFYMRCAVTRCCRVSVIATLKDSLRMGFVGIHSTTRTACSRKSLSE